MKSFYAFIVVIAVFMVGTMALVLSRIPAAAPAAAGECQMEGCDMSGMKSAAPPKSATTSRSIVCPVTHEKIATLGKTTDMTVYKGKTYYFCCPSCKPKFDREPGHYVDQQGQQDRRTHTS